MVKIKNISGGDYSVGEIGGHLLADAEEVDLMNDALPVFYDDYATAVNLVTVVNGSKLYQDIQSGKVSVVGFASPVD